MFPRLWLVSYLVAGAVAISQASLTRRAANDTGLQPQATYNGNYTEATDIRLRIGNGGAGQSGLIGAWADAFIKYCVETRSIAPFKVGWYLGDTTASLGFLAAGQIDLAVTYNDAAEQQSLQSGAATQRVYGFRDHFLLVGPKSNPANLSADSDDVLQMFNKLVSVGNADAAVPWAFGYSIWYHQYPRFPLQAIEAASLLSEYTLTDRGTWLSSPATVTDNLNIYKAGSDNATDPLLNPARVLLGSKADSANKEIWTAFMEWVVSADGGQKVIREFKKNGQVLYSEAPTDGA
ncbi:hypothetical protein H0H87_012883 [Tephrocybe sp. NHM501043]|nr:hypothetical protein H0H87_012883 [Tephrocybe sp. NHM501043]